MNYFIKKPNFLTKIFQNVVRNKDIREFKKNFYYYIFFRLIRFFLNEYVEIKIYNFKILASNRKNHTSHALLKKCNFDDQHELKTIKKFSADKNVFLIDCGCNYGFYSFYTASLSSNNLVIAFEASPRTSEDFNKNLYLNNFNNITLNNLAVSDVDKNKVTFNESYNDWESSLSHNKFIEKKLTSISTITIDTTLGMRDLKDYHLFIKLDIEGHEFHAIKGATNTIKKFRPIFIIEFSKYIFENNQDNFNFLETFLSSFDYNIYGTNNNLISLKEIMKLLKDLNPDHKTIGNYYLIKNDEKIKNILINE